MFVKCLNCGGAETSWPTILALLFAGAAVLVAARSLWLQASEHKRLTAELAKRADFALTIRPMGNLYESVGSDSAELTTPASSVLLLLEIGITNTGDRAATHTALNVLAPQRYRNLTWSLPNGAPIDRLATAAATSEQLENEECWWISDEIERVALRTPRLRHATVDVEVPQEGEVTVQVRVKAQSDDLPDDVEERVKDFTVRVSRRSSDD